MKIRLDLDSPDQWARALEGLVSVNRLAIRRGEVPADLYSTGIRYEKELGTEDWITAKQGLAAGKMDCEDLSAYRIAALREEGETEARPGIKKTGRSTWHAVVIRADGSIEDPTRILQGKDPMPNLLGQDEEPEEPARAIDAEPDDVEIKWRLVKLARGQGWASTLKIPIAIRRLFIAGEDDEEDYQVIGWITGQGRGWDAREAGDRAADDAHRKGAQMSQRWLREYRARQRRRREGDDRDYEDEDRNDRRRRRRRRGERVGFFPGFSSMMSMVPGAAAAAPGAAAAPAIPGLPATLPTIPGMPPGLVPPGPAPGMPAIPGMPGLPPGMPGIPPEAAAAMAAFKLISKAAAQPAVKAGLKKAATGAKKLFKKLKLWGYVEAI